MFEKAFDSRIDAILAALSAAEVVTMPLLGTCLNALTTCLREAEVRDQCVRQYLDLVLDRFRRTPSMSGAQLSQELRGLLGDTSGLEVGADTTWPDTMPVRKMSSPSDTTRWDAKELDNRLTGLNRASVSRLRHAIGLTSERPIELGTRLSRRKRFRACKTMQVNDIHDAAINGEQVNRLIRYLGWGDSDSDPRGGRYAILG